MKATHITVSRFISQCFMRTSANGVMIKQSTMLVQDTVDCSVIIAFGTTKLATLNRIQFSLPLHHLTAISVNPSSKSGLLTLRHVSETTCDTNGACRVCKTIGHPPHSACGTHRTHVHQLNSRCSLCFPSLPDRVRWCDVRFGVCR